MTIPIAEARSGNIKTTAKMTMVAVPLNDPNRT